MDYLRQAYYAFFESIFRYGLLLYDSGSNLRDILLLQKRAVRVITGSLPKESCRPLFKQKGIMTVYNLYIFELLTYLKKNENEYTF